MPRAGKDPAGGAGGEKSARPTPKAAGARPRTERAKAAPKSTAARAPKTARAAEPAAGPESASASARELELLRDECRALTREVEQARRQLADESQTHLTRFREELAELRRAVLAVTGEMRPIQDKLHDLGRQLVEAGRKVHEIRQEMGGHGQNARDAHQERTAIGPRTVAVEREATPAVPERAEAPADRATETESESQNRLGVAVDPGVVVAEVRPGTPAAEAGLEPGDVIAAVNGEPVVTALELRDLVDTSPDGNEIVVAFRRRATANEVRVRLGVVVAEGEGATDIHSRFGVTVDPCVVVAQVEPGSPAELAGLINGDALIAVDGSPVVTATQLRESVQHHAPGTTLSLRLIRGSETREVLARLAEAFPEPHEPG